MSMLLYQEKDTLTVNINFESFASKLQRRENGPHYPLRHRCNEHDQISREGGRSHGDGQPAAARSLQAVLPGHHTIVDPHLGI